MSEEILKEFGKFEEVTPEQILNALLRKSKVELHTELHNPLAVTLIEIYSGLIKKYSVSSAEIVKDFVKRFRVNMVAYDRKRAKEVVDAYKSVREFEENRGLRETLLGVK
ncbi:MAG: hypothetical protein ACKD6O_08170 [Candidatus Bathyarchaeota archaeon]